MGGRKEYYKKCLLDGCDKYGMYQGYCHSHYTTYVYRRRPEVKERLRQSHRDKKGRFNRSRHFAITHGMPWEFGYEQFCELVTKPCHYCGADLSNETGRGLDRLDNMQGYVPANVVPCCGNCNRMRGFQIQPDEMKVMMDAVTEYRKRKSA